MKTEHFTAESQRTQSCAEKSKDFIAFHSAFLCALRASAVNDLLFNRPLR